MRGGQRGPSWVAASETIVGFSQTKTVGGQVIRFQSAAHSMRLVRWMGCYSAEASATRRGSRASPPSPRLKVRAGALSSSQTTLNAAHISRRSSERDGLARQSRRASPRKTSVDKPEPGSSAWLSPPYRAATLVSGRSSGSGSACSRRTPRSRHCAASAASPLLRRLSVPSRRSDSSHSPFAGKGCCSSTAAASGQNSCQPCRAACAASFSEAIGPRRTVRISPHSDESCAAAKAAAIFVRSLRNAPAELGAGRRKSRAWWRRSSSVTPRTVTTEGRGWPRKSAKLPENGAKLATVLATAVRYHLILHARRAVRGGGCVVFLSFPRIAVGRTELLQTEGRKGQYSGTRLREIATKGAESVRVADPFYRFACFQRVVISYPIAASTKNFRSISDSRVRD